MTRADLSTTGILNAVAPRLRNVSPAATAVLLVTALPLRLLQIHFIDLLLRLRGDAPHYGNLLMAVSALTVSAFVVSLYGRAVFIQAFHVPSNPARGLLRVNAKSLLTYVYVALTIEIGTVLFSFTMIAIPLAVILAGVAAAATVDPAQPGIVAPLRALSRYLTHGRVLAGLISVLSIAYVVALINLFFLARIIVWMAGAIPAFDSVKWSAALNHSSRFGLALLAGAATLVEPFFLTAMNVFADRVRESESGDDLLFRFRALTSQKAAAVIVMIAFVCAPSAIVRAEGSHQTFTTVQYIHDLRTIREAYSSRQYGVAALAADKLDSVQSISAGPIHFEADHALLRRVREAALKSKLDLVLAGRLSATVDALGTGGTKSDVRNVDNDLLERIRAREKTGELARGGELNDFPDATPTLGQEIARIFRRVMEWLASKLERLFDWIMRLWPAEEKDSDRPSMLGISVVVWIVTLLIVMTLLLLAAYVLRRSKRRLAPILSEEIASSSRDADPLSRESNEWERYATELAASGLLREAIRAWYHAVLVTLYRAGLLHYRKGMTNWEYVSALAPSLEWRPYFISMTRQFDREWYGRRETTPDVLDSCVADAHVILVAVRESR